jgi:prepilin-type N-terminal cleavage/methylation domain-containing protein
MKKQAGFTLIETLMAMAIFTIGILALFGMQSAAITQNVVANKITTGSTWATDQVEQLISLPYNHDYLVDGGGTNNGCAGLNDWPDPQQSPALTADSQAFDVFSSGTTPVYNIYWNVAQDCTLTNIPVAGVKPEEVQRPKHVRVLVTIENGNGTEELKATYNYIKQNIVKKDD